MKTLTGKSVVDLTQIDKTPSSVYIPRHLLKSVDELITKQGLKREGLRGVLGVLLENYEAGVYGELPASKKGKKLYQQAGMGLKKRNFHPSNGDWAALVNHARVLGYAANLFFVKLLYLEMQREDIIKTGLPRKKFVKVEEKVQRLKHLCYVEILEFGRTLTRKFAHGP